MKIPNGEGTQNTGGLKSFFRSLIVMILI